MSLLLLLTACAFLADLVDDPAPRPDGLRAEVAGPPPPLSPDGAIAVSDPATAPRLQVAGRVMDGEGAPVADWPVVAQERAWPRAWREVARTGADGRFLADLPEGARVRVPAGGADVVVRPEMPADVLEVMLGPLREVTVRFAGADGHVVDGPLRVVFGGVMLAQVGPEGGRVRFPERRVEPWFLGPGGSSLAPRRGMSWQPDAAVPGLLEGQGEVVVPIHPASHRRVRVVDADGVPVVGAWVHTLHGTDGWTDEEGTVDVWSRREEGLFGFEMLEVEAFGFAPWSSSADLLLLDPLWDLLAGEGPRTEEVRLDRARTVEVVCVGAREPGCAELSKLACAATPGRSGRADACRTWGDVRVCACPEEGWVLGGGLFAEVTPAPTVALDLLAASGGLRGGACEEDGVLLVSEDWSMARHERRKLLSLIENPGSRDSVCEDGRSVVRGLPPGRWVVYGHDVGPRREEVSFSSPADVLAWMAAAEDEDRPVVEVGQDVVDLDAVLR